jgi:hypothetical protein
MGKISSYQQDATPSLTDKLIGTDVNDSNITKNYTIGGILGLISLGATQVLNKKSTSSQEPSGTNSPLVVEFGGASGTVNDDVMIDASGYITFNTAGLYLVNGFGAIERVGSSGGVAIFLFRGVLNGVQATEVKCVHIDTTDITTPYEITIPFQASAGDVFHFEVMRDSSGVNAGGLYSTATLGGWGDTPSSQIQIWKIGN